MDGELLIRLASSPGLRPDDFGARGIGALRCILISGPFLISGKESCTFSKPAGGTEFAFGLKPGDGAGI